MNSRIPIPTEGLLTTDEAQVMLGVSRRTLYRMLNKGLAHITIGDRTLFCENCLRAMRDDVNR